MNNTNVSDKVYENLGRKRDRVAGCKYESWRNICHFDFLNVSLAQQKVLPCMKSKFIRQ